MLAEPALDFQVMDRNEQEVLISIEGEDVHNFKDNLQGPPPENELTLPDPVQAFVDAARRGMFTNSTTPPWQSGAELLKKEVDLPASKQTWRVLFRNIDPGAYRVLTNILRARLLNSISMKTISPIAAGPDDALIDLKGLAYPSPYQPIPFDLNYETPTRSSRDRYVHLIFAAEPDDATAAIVFAALETWTWLMLLGGYPSDDMHPKQSAAVPEPAFLLDPRTIEQPFPDVFLCDDDCYAAVINWAQVLHQFTYPLQVVQLR